MMKQSNINHHKGGSLQTPVDISIQIHDDKIIKKMINSRVIGKQKITLSFFKRYRKDGLYVYVFDMCAY